MEEENVNKTGMCLHCMKHKEIFDIPQIKMSGCFDCVSSKLNEITGAHKRDFIAVSKPEEIG